MPDDEKSGALVPNADAAKSASVPDQTSSGCEVLEKLKIEAPDILASLPKENRAKLIRIIESQTVMRHHEGPLPAPEDIALYNQHIPNGADRIMALAEKQFEHRRNMESLVIPGKLASITRGQIFGLVIALVGIIAGTVITLYGHDTVGGILLGTTIVSLVGVFLFGQRQQSKQPASGK